MMYRKKANLGVYDNWDHPNFLRDEDSKKFVFYYLLVTIITALAMEWVGVRI